MQRLIDADALHSEISKWPESVMYKDWVQSAIATAPTVPSDVQPVQRGQWIPEDECYEEDVYICSVCGYEFIITAGDLESNKLKYCPGCGAKMDGGEDDGILQKSL